MATKICHLNVKKSIECLLSIRPRRNLYFMVHSDYEPLHKRPKNSKDIHAHKKTMIIFIMRIFEANINKKIKDGIAFFCEARNFICSEF